MHPSEEFPIEGLGCDGMKRNRLYGSLISIGHHTADDCLGLFDQSSDGLVRHVLRDGLILRGGRCASQRMAENGGLGGRREGVLIAFALALRPLRDRRGHIIDQAVDSALSVVSMGGALRDDK